MKTKTHLIRWCDPVLKDLGTDKQFGNGANTYWAQDDNINIKEDRIDIFEPNTNYPNRGCEISVKAGSEHHYIAYVEFDMGRHFTKPFTWMGVEWFQSHDSNNSCHIKRSGASIRDSLTALSTTTALLFTASKAQGYFISSTDARARDCYAGGRLLV